MDPMSLVLGALGLGAVAGFKETATAAVKDAYAGLKDLVSGKLSAQQSALVALAEHENDPETWRAPLEKALVSSGAIDDESILAAARRLMELADSGGSQMGKYLVDARGTRNVQVGDHNRQVNVSGTYVEHPAPRQS